MKLSIEDFKGMLAAISNIMQENKEYLIELDSIMGDGDLGLSMSRGFNAADQAMADFSEDDIGKALFMSAMAMNNAAPSTMGTLVSSAIMSAGKEVKGLKEIGLEEISGMAQAAVDGIMKRGKAKVGEKTILDSLVPAVNAFKNSIATGESFEEAIYKSVQEAEKGVEVTKSMLAQHGRAHYYGDKSKGKQDPGATVAMLAVKALRNYFQQN